MKTQPNLIWICLLELVLLALPAAVQAQFTFTTSNNAITITGYTGPGGVATIPNTIVVGGINLPVTSIYDYAFMNLGNLTSITIPGNVTEIGIGAFENCSNLITVTVGSGVNYIGDGAFDNCWSLSEIIFQGNAPYLGGDIFFNDNYWPHSEIAYYLPWTTGWGTILGGGVYDQIVTMPSLEGQFGIQYDGNPNSGPVPLSVNFTSPGVDSGGNTITQWSWNFGDGTTGTAQNPSHVYSTTGIFFPTLVATNSGGFVVHGYGGPSINVSSTNVSGIYIFTALSDIVPYGTNNDGANPAANLIVSGDIFYGTTQNGGLSGYGSVFAVNANGTSFTNLFSFTDGNDGANPSAGLVLVGNTLYGTAEFGGGSGDYGTVFAINTDGTSFTNLHSFSGYPGDGAYPGSRLILSGNTLYGAAAGGGIGHNGTIFSMNTDGSGFTNLYSFTATFYPYETNSDGASPVASLILSGNTLYGTAESGGSINGNYGDAGNGTVFAIKTDGSSFTNLHDFTDGNDGAYPAGGLILSGDTLFGTASGGGANVNGVLFAIKTDGSGFTNLYTFSASGYYNNSGYTNNDGSYPVADLILSGDTLYGTAEYSGVSGDGVVFAIRTDGSGFTNLYNFTGGSDGANPVASLLLSGNTLFGTTQNGGTNNTGTIFSIPLSLYNSPLPTITGISLSGANLVITGSNGQSGGTYKVLMTTNLTLPRSQWTPVTTNILYASGNFSLIVTNAVNQAVSKRFYLFQIQ